MSIELNALRPVIWRVNTDPFTIAIRSRLSRFRDFPFLLLVDWVELLSGQFRQGCWSALSAAEKQRHGAFRMKDDRERFLVGRGVLRQLLGAWLGQAPKEIVLSLGHFGKPFCSGGPEFNLSHSGRLILIGLHPCRAVGVDVERMDTRLDWHPIATRLWDKKTVAEIVGHDSEDQCAVFFQHWCNHEAVCKATGLGLTAPSTPDSSSWNGRLWNVLLPPGYRGSIALVGRSPLAPQSF
jgi:4'-phosphopantetheinyl transferase